MTGLIAAGLFFAAAGYIVGLSLWYVLTGQNNNTATTARIET